MCFWYTLFHKKVKQNTLILTWNSVQFLFLFFHRDHGEVLSMSEEGNEIIPGKLSCNHRRLSKMSSPAIQTQLQEMCLPPLPRNQTTEPESSLYRNYRATASPPVKKEQQKQTHPGSTPVFPAVEMKMTVQIWQVPLHCQGPLGESYVIVPTSNHKYYNNNQDTLFLVCSTEVNEKL